MVTPAAGGVVDGDPAVRAGDGAVGDVHRDARAGAAELEGDRLRCWCRRGTAVATRAVVMAMRARTTAVVARTRVRPVEFCIRWCCFLVAAAAWWWILRRAVVRSRCRTVCARVRARDLATMSATSPSAEDHGCRHRYRVVPAQGTRTISSSAGGLNGAVTVWKYRMPATITEPPPLMMVPAIPPRVTPAESAGTQATMIAHPMVPISATPMMTPITAKMMDVMVMPAGASS